MNDDTRVGPKKGTDGTAGGISEKEKERRRKGYEGNKPQEPKTAPELPHSEQEWIQKEKEEGSKTKTGEASKESTETEKEGKEFGAGGYGMQKPENLPEKPHNIPHPDPAPGKTATKESSDGSSRDAWLQDTMPYTEGQTNPKPPKKSYWGSKNAPSGESAPAYSDDESWHEWFHSFVLSFTMILFSEIGDKTFLVAALMAMRHARILVFSAAFGALIVMTVLSAVLGHAFPTILPKRLTTFAAAMLFLVFGARSLKEGLAMSPDEGVGEEMKEVEAELEEKEHSMARESRRRSSLTPYALESGRGRQPNIKPSEPSPPSSRSPSPPSRNRSMKDRLSGLTNLLSLILSPAWVQTFIMTFLGEWGDRSQIATIAMAAGQDYWWVTLGAISGHAICTGLAVVGGRALAGKVSLRVGKSISPILNVECVANGVDSHDRRRSRLPRVRSYISVRVFDGVNLTLHFTFGIPNAYPYCNPL
jgi:putative Ca2+/H+ antiporter (TMEM165/GDT1 family)